jgi:hypothetical protein
MVARPRACYGQQAPLPLEILRVRDRIDIGRRNCRRCWHHSVRHTYDSDRPEFKPLHSVHGADPHRVLL